MFLFAIIGFFAMDASAQGQAANTSECEISCVFGSCKAKCSNGKGTGAACLCIWGFPECGCGGGGAAVNVALSADHIQNLEAFRTVLRAFNTSSAQNVITDLYAYENEAKGNSNGNGNSENAGNMGIIHKTVSDMHKLSRAEKDAVNTFFQEKGVNGRL